MSRREAAATRLAIASAAALVLGLGLWGLASPLRPIDLWPGHPLVLAAAAAYGAPILRLARRLHAPANAPARAQTLAQAAIFSIIGLSGAMLLAMGSVSWLNARLDPSSGEVRRTEIVSKEAGISLARRGVRTTEYVLVRSWRLGRETEPLGLDRDAYALARPGIDRVRVVTSPGFLGLERLLGEPVLERGRPAEDPRSGGR